MIIENSSVHDEQFGGEKVPSENTGNEDQDTYNKEESSGLNEETESSDIKNDSSAEEITTSETEEPEDIIQEELVNDISEGPDQAAEVEETVQTEEVKEPDQTEEDDIEPEINQDNSSEVKENEGNNIVKSLDLSTLSKAQLVEALKNLLLHESVESVKDDIESVKVHFYKIHTAYIEELKNKFIEEGGNPEDFKPAVDEQENKLKELLDKYKDQRANFNRKLEEDKVDNLAKKHEVIEKIKDLVNRKESINKTFNEFRELQKEWRNLGLVPQQNLKDLWESYHLACEMFYDYIKINKDLRDLDLKKNMEAKIRLCERAEKLLLEPSVVNAFRILQNLHDQWREIGPVPVEQKTELWERFKEITSKINKKHHQYFENLKDSQKTNLKEKALLCEKVEEINKNEITGAREWEDKSREIIEIQKMWKSIGFAPKKDNNKIYTRFRTACDTFFNNKREFFASNKEEQKNNLQLKTDLCVQAETLKDSTDWKNSTEELINLQKRWKEIGPVPKKHSDQLWERFRSACDSFFNRKEKFFSNIDSSYDENLKLKNDLIEEIENYKFSDDIEKNFENINNFQKRWADIGFVPIKYKDEIQNRYRDTINKLFDTLKVDDEEKYLLKFENRINDITSKPNPGIKLKQEREKLYKRLTKLEGDLVVWENNIGFFAKSKGADSLIKDVKTKIEDAKNTIELIQQKIRVIDEFRETNSLG